MKKLKNLLIKKINNKGFTLVELLLYMGLLSILLLVFTDILVQFANVRSDSVATASVEQDGRFILARLRYDISRATSINVPVSSGDLGQTLTLNIGGSNYTYSFVNGNLVLTTTLGADNLNSTNTIVVSPSFQKIGPAAGKVTVKLQFTLNSTTVRSQGIETKTFATTVGQR